MVTDPHNVYAANTVRSFDHSLSPEQLAELGISLPGAPVAVADQEQIQDLPNLAKYDLALTQSPNLSRTDSRLPILDNATINSDSTSNDHKINIADLIKKNNTFRSIKSLKSMKSKNAAIQKQLSRKGINDNDISIIANDNVLNAPEVTIVDNTNQQLKEKLEELEDGPLSRERRIKYLVLMLIVFVCVSIAVFGSVVYLKNVFDKRKLATDAQDSRYIEFFNGDKNTDLH